MKTKMLLLFFLIFIFVLSIFVIDLTSYNYNKVDSIDYYDPNDDDEIDLDVDSAELDDELISYYNFDVDYDSDEDLDEVQMDIDGDTVDDADDAEFNENDLYSVVQTDTDDEILGDTLEQTPEPSNDEENIDNPNTGAYLSIIFITSLTVVLVIISKNTKKYGRIKKI